MADRKILSYQFTKTQKRIITPVYLSSSAPTPANPITVNALWDTGATLSAITPDIARKLNLVSIDTTPIAGVHGINMVDVVYLFIELPDQIVKEKIKAAVCNFGPNLGIILGMNIISLGDFSIKNGKGQTLFTFTVPPIE